MTKPPRVLGYLGHSNCWRTIRGWIQSGSGGNESIRPWPPTQGDIDLTDYGGGVLEAWGDPTYTVEGFDPGEKYDLLWSRFDQALNTYGADFIWMMTFTYVVRTSSALLGADVSLIRHISKQIRARTSAPIFFSPMHTYQSGGYCDLAGTAGVAWSQQLVRYALMKDLVDYAGPQFDYFAAAHIDADTCHCTAAGEARCAEQLARFFHALTWLKPEHARRL